MSHFHSTGTDKMVADKLDIIAINAYYSDDVRSTVSELLDEYENGDASATELRSLLGKIERHEIR